MKESSPLQLNHVEEQTKEVIDIPDDGNSPAHNPVVLPPEFFL